MIARLRVLPLLWMLTPGYSSLGVVAAVAEAVTPPATLQTGTRDRMERALALLAGEDAERAIPLLLSVVDEVPFHGPARLQLGALAVERGEWEIAVDHLKAAVGSYGPEAPEGAFPVQRPGLAWALYSEALGQAARLEDALEATGEALRLSPSYLPALLGRSNFARQLAIVEGAVSTTGARAAFLEVSLDAARGAQVLAPERPGPWTALSLAAHEAQIAELARCAAERAAELAPDDPRSLYLVAWTSAEADPEGALTAAEAALAAGLRDGPALWMTLGRLRAFRLDMDASLDAYREALRLDAGVAGEMASLALDAIAAGEDEELRTLLRDRAARRPDALNTRFALAKAELREGRIEPAVRELSELAEREPDHSAILTTLHAALRRAGATSVTETVLARLEVVKAAEAAAWERANALEERRRSAREAATRGDPAEAARSWEVAVSGREQTPATGEASRELAADLRELGAALEALGRHAEALSALDRSLTLSPFDSVALSAAARVARATGQDEEAARYSERARLAAADCR